MFFRFSQCFLAFCSHRPKKYIVICGRRIIFTFLPFHAYLAGFVFFSLFPPPPVIHQPAFYRPILCATRIKLSIFISKITRSMGRVDILWLPQPLIHPSSLWQPYIRESGVTNFGFGSFSISNPKTNEPHFVGLDTLPATPVCYIGCVEQPAGGRRPPSLAPLSGLNEPIFFLDMKNGNW